jgi:hypothetical protein
MLQPLAGLVQNNQALLPLRNRWTSLGQCLVWTYESRQATMCSPGVAWAWYCKWVPWARSGGLAAPWGNLALLKAAYSSWKHVNWTSMKEVLPKYYHKFGVIYCFKQPSLIIQWSRLAFWSIWLFPKMASWTMTHYIMHSPQSWLSYNYALWK